MQACGNKRIQCVYRSPQACLAMQLQLLGSQLVTQTDSVFVGCGGFMHCFAGFCHSGELL